MDASFIRTSGDNFIHASAFDYLIAGDSIEQPARSSQASSEVGRRAATIDLIGQHVASIVRDGDTLQFGAGTVSSAMPHYLFEKQDLGIHTEACPQAIIDLVQAGVITGIRKTLHPGKIVASVFAVVDEDLALIDHNPSWELYDINYIDNPIIIARHDNFVSVNTCLQIDLTGQINAESLGPDMYSGAGGQPDFVLGALLSKGGRAITVMQSTAKSGGLSTIVPAFAAGTPVTVSRNYVDLVVTEFGIASLQGKTLRQRANELISIAHPDYRADLRAAAVQMFGAW